MSVVIGNSPGTQGEPLWGWPPDHRAPGQRGQGSSSLGIGAGSGTGPRTRLHGGCIWPGPCASQRPLATSLGPTATSHPLWSLRCPRRTALPLPPLAGHGEVRQVPGEEHGLVGEGAAARVAGWGGEIRPHGWLPWAKWVIGNCRSHAGVVSGQVPTPSDKGWFLYGWELG